MFVLEPQLIRNANGSGLDEDGVGDERRERRVRRMKRWGFSIGALYACNSSSVCV